MQISDNTRNIKCRCFVYCIALIFFNLIVIKNRVFICVLYTFFGSCSVLFNILEQLYLFIDIITLVLRTQLKLNKSESFCSRHSTFNSCLQRLLYFTGFWQMFPIDDFKPGFFCLIYSQT